MTAGQNISRGKLLQPEGGHNDWDVGDKLLSTVKLSGEYNVGSQSAQMFTVMSSNMIIK